jgi:hypothetical protein
VSVTVQARPAGKRPVGRPKKVIIFKFFDFFFR